MLEQAGPIPYICTLCGAPLHLNGSSFPLPEKGLLFNFLVPHAEIRLLIYGCFSFLPTVSLYLLGVVEAPVEMSL